MLHHTRCWHRPLSPPQAKRYHRPAEPSRDGLRGAGGEESSPEAWSWLNQKQRSDVEAAKEARANAPPPFVPEQLLVVDQHHRKTRLGKTTARWEACVISLADGELTLHADAAQLKRDDAWHVSAACDVVRAEIVEASAGLKTSDLKRPLIEDLRQIGPPVPGKDGEGIAASKAASRRSRRRSTHPRRRR